MTSLAREVRISLRSRITCPHCWDSFSPENILWIAAHPDLTNDARLGADAALRFLPTRFSAEGNAIDVRGAACQELACPRCHLSIPRALLELAPLFVSIAGTPSCGKSYFLAAMTWTMRHSLPRDFQLSYTDADPQSNLILNQYEEEQFLNPQQDTIVKLSKTEEQGDAYDQVRYGEQVVSYPRPFLFALRPARKHPSHAAASKVARSLCLYDNAGESFLPGKDTVVNPVTRHLAKSQAVLYCFDPTQDVRFRAACSEGSQDYQVQHSPVTARQETVLHEIVNRIRQHTGLKQTERRRQPLIVVITKYDAWWRLLGEERLSAPTRSISDGAISGLDAQRVKAVSQATRSLMQQFSPELVAAAEEFSSNTWFIPVSATGSTPEYGGERDGKAIWGIRPRDIKPMWCDVPMLVAIASTTSGLIPICSDASSDSP